MQYLLGIDLGSTSIKTVLHDEHGNAVAKAVRPMRKFYPNAEHPEWTVWEPDVLWQDVCAAVQELVLAAQKTASAACGECIAGIAVTGMGMDGLPLDETGNALYPFISWLDRRTEPQLDWWTKNIGLEKTFSRTGSPMWAIHSALRMLWLKENEPAIFQNTFKWLLIEDFINYKLCRKLATDYSMASCTMLFDLPAKMWSDELCNLSGIPKNILPDAEQSGTFLGELTDEAAAATGLTAGTPVFLGGHDHFCGALPVGVFKPGTVYCITGTWETIELATKQPALNPALGEAGLMTQAHVAPDCFMLWGGNPTGETLEWWRNNSNEELVPYQTLTEQASASPAGSGGVMFLPHLGGAKCPLPEPAARGAFLGLNQQTNRNDLTRAVFEGLGYQLLDVITAMENGTGTKTEEIVVVGGSTRNKFWMQNKADMLGVNVIVPEIDEAVALGAAMLAGIGTGIFKSVEDAYRIVSRRGLAPAFYEPDESKTAFYQEKFLQYQKAFAALQFFSQEDKGK
ncbi:MAG: hypothetical protein LBN39_11235 [Planctomycetaceae bacterium]|jgi:xylulokinase|nr:hypothetical protein [Planctomycetaceae bacterium]